MVVEKYLVWIPCNRAPITSNCEGLNNIHSLTYFYLVMLMWEVKGHQVKVTRSHYP